MRGITCGGAADSLDGVGLDGAQAVDLGDERGHAQVLEGARVADAAVLHPHVRHAQLAPKALRPEQVAVALKHALDVVVLDLLRSHATLHIRQSQISLVITGRTS